MISQNIYINFLRKYGLSLLLFISWIIQAYPILTTNPHFEEIVVEVKKIHEDVKKEVEQPSSTLSKNISPELLQNAVMDLKQQWILNIIFVVLGLASAICAFFQIRYWVIIVVFTSVMYLGVWYSSGSLSAFPPVTAMQLKWSTAKLFHSEMSFFIKDVVLPIFYIWVIGYLTYRSFVIYKLKK
jgi:hypothetical protein